MDAIFLVTKLATHGKCLFSNDSSKVPVGKAGAAFPGSGRRLSPKKSLWLVACVSQMNKRPVTFMPLGQGKRLAPNTSMGKSFP